MRTNQPLIEEDVPRYRKKVKPHSPAKSKHKHDYQRCVFEFSSPTYVNVNGFSVQEDVTQSGLGTYCPICGKIGTLNWAALLSRREALTQDDLCELDPKTRTVPTFWLDDVFDQKFVKLE